jgi:nucleoside-diphosphate-sugar epimerase
VEVLAVSAPARVLITGTMGYVGPVLARHLRRAHPRMALAGFDSGFFASALTVDGRLPETRLGAQYFGDVRELPEDLLASADAVVHLAAISNDPMGRQFESVTDEINHRATMRLATLARNAGVRRFVFASSCSVYGASGAHARTEQDPVAPLTAYARSKVDVENAFRAMDLGAMQVTCLRFATACGMSERLRLDLVLNDFVASALATGTIQVLSDGTPWRPLIDVRDMARAIDWACHRRTEDSGPLVCVNTGSEDWNYTAASRARRYRSTVTPHPTRAPTRSISRCSARLHPTTSRGSVWTNASTVCAKAWRRCTAWAPTSASRDSCACACCRRMWTRVA